LGTYSFDLATGHDLYCKLKRDFRRYQDNPTDSDLAWNCAVTAWHVREWVWKQRLLHHPGDDLMLFGASFANNEEYNAELNRRCPRYKLLKELCNGSKHFRLNALGRVRSTTTKPGALYGAILYNEALYNEGPYHAIVLDDGSTERFSEVLGQVVSFWDTVFSGEPCS